MKNKKKHIPRKLVFLFILLGIIIVSIPIYYITAYTTTKIDVIEKLGVTENVRELDYDKVEDYDITVECTNFDVTNDMKAVFKITINEDDISNLTNNRFTVKAVLAANWISSDAYKASGSGSITMTNTNKYATVTVSNIDVFANRTNYLVPFPRPTLYIHVSYSTTRAGSTTNYNDIIEYPYGSYKIETGGF